MHGIQMAYEGRVEMLQAIFGKAEDPETPSEPVSIVKQLSEFAEAHKAKSKK